jgi:hypothetical protein
VTVVRRGSASGEARLGYRTLSGGSYNGFAATQGELVWSDGDASPKIVTVSLDSATLSGGQSGTFQLELFGAVNASLQNSSGADVATLPVTITVSDSSTPTSPPPTIAPPRSSGGGGGSFDLLWLALLSGLWAARRLLRAS